MDAQRINRIEKSNRNMIYLYIDVENETCVAYEFSAFLLTRVFNTLKLEEEKIPVVGAIFFKTKLPLKSITDHFKGNNITVGDEYIRIVLDDEPRCPAWRNIFDELKIQQQKDNNVLGEAILGFFRLGE